MEDAPGWTSILRDFGLPTFLLLVFVGIGVWGLRTFFPLAKELVASHVSLVASLKEEFRLLRVGQQEFRDYLKNRDAQADLRERGLRDELKGIRAILERESRNVSR